MTAGGKSRCSSPPPEKKSAIWGGGGLFAIFSPRGGLSVPGGEGLAFPRLEAFLIYFIYVGAFMLHFLPCGGLFAIFSLCRSPFLSLWGVFLGLIAPPPPPPYKIFCVRSWEGGGADNCQINRQNNGKNFSNLKLFYFFSKNLYFLRKFQF